MSSTPSVDTARLANAIRFLAADAREVFTGFWILEVASREEAEHWARKCPLGPGTALEVRRVNEFADFDMPDNEWVAKEQEWRAANS